MTQQVLLSERVRFVETDMMGVVHHANYFAWFEAGRVLYLRRCGIDLNELMQAGILFPITEAACQYKASARFDDVVQIWTLLQEFSRAKLIFTYDVVRQSDGRLLAQGRTQNVFTNHDGRIIRLPAAYYERLQRGPTLKN